MSVLDMAIGWLAPPDCVNCGKEGSSLCAGCLDLIQSFGQRCWRCNALSAGSYTCPSCRRTGSPSRVFICTDYQGLPRELIAVFKFGHRRSAASVLAGLMAQSLLDIEDIVSDYLVVPIPTATSRWRERGFGHTELLARQLSRKLDIRYQDSLGRLGQARQLGSRREDRLRQLTDMFYVRKSESLLGAKVLLIDDVVTTGGTLIAATQALRKSGAARVDALVFAKKL